MNDSERADDAESRSKTESKRKRQAHFYLQKGNPHGHKKKPDKHPAVFTRHTFPSRQTLKISNETPLLFGYFPRKA
ncbi:MAG: hypothetical protein K2G61_05700 [Bacteroidaceae bacterium]|nr:hypothetical protein [Bacteroidaceae bacterium]